MASSLNSRCGCSMYLPAIIMQDGVMENHAVASVAPQLLVSSPAAAVVAGGLFMPLPAAQVRECR